VITDRPNELDSLIEHDGRPVVIVRWPGGDAGLGRTYARDVAAAIDAQRAAMRASLTTLTHAEQLAEADAAIARLTRERDGARATLAREQIAAVNAERERDAARAKRAEGDAIATKHLDALRELAWDIAGERFEYSPGWTSGEECLGYIRAKWDTRYAQLRAEAREPEVRLTRERDEAREDFESASYDTARLITAIRTLTHTEAWALSEDVEANGRAGWVAEARKLGGKVEGMRGSLERERDEARAEVERLRANLASIVTHVREPQDAEIARLRERETLLMLAMAWGRELAEHAGCVDCWAFDAHEELIEESLDLAETLGVDTGSDYDLIATARRLRERVDFYELGHYRAKALEDALSSEEAQAVRGVLLAAVAWNELATQGPIGKRLSAALEAWTAAGRPLLAAVPAPASEGER
jgi:hypothetical protein